LLKENFILFSIFVFVNKNSMCNTCGCGQMEKKEGEGEEKEGEEKEEGTKE
jgi:hypothetical protein